MWRVTQFQAGARGGAYVGTGGCAVAGGAHSVRITGPEGNTYAHGRIGVVAAGPYSMAAGAHGTAVAGPYGTAAAGARGAMWSRYAPHYPAAPVWHTPYPVRWYVR
jgi:hypothetical protein